MVKLNVMLISVMTMVLAQKIKEVKISVIANQDTLVTDVIVTKREKTNSNFKSKHHSMQ